MSPRFLTSCTAFSCSAPRFAGHSWRKTSTGYPAWEIPYSATAAAPYSFLGGTPTVEILESGPARLSLGVTRFNAGSTFTERIRLAAGGGGDRLEWDVSVTWGTRQTLLKVVFPLSATNSMATYDLGLGTIQRPNSNANLYEVPAQQWADLTSAEGAFGVTLMSDSKYGWDKPDSRTLRLTIFHTPGVGSSFVYQATNGFGSHRFTFGLMGHTNDWRGASPWAAARLNQPLQAFQTAPHAGTLGKSFSFLACNNSNVMVKAMKKAENSTEIVVRLQELSGQPQAAQLTFATPINTARLVTGTEDHLASLSPSGGTLALSLSPYQPITLAVTLASPASFIPRSTSTPVPLAFNLDVISTDANRTDGDFEAGYSYPAELMPATLVRGGITFQLGATNDGGLNALACQGQTLSLPSGYDRLYFLAASASNDLTAAFSIGGQPVNVSVQHFSGFIGQWNPPLLKPDEVAWVCTHRHAPAGNDAYRFCYLFKYRVDLPPGASTLTLPEAPNLRLFALSVARNTTADTTASGGPLDQNEPPWANAGPDRRVNADPSLQATVQLDATGSADPDGQIASFVWTTNGIVLATGPRPTVSLPMGTNQLVLAVTDDRGHVSRDALSIIVVTPLDVLLTAVPTNGATAPLTVQFGAQATGGKATTADTTDDQSGTVTAQGQNGNSGEVAGNAFDNSPASKWLDFANGNPSTRASWIQYHYADNARYVVTSYNITSANDAPERDPAAWQLRGSNDGGSTWTPLGVRTNEVFSARLQRRSFTTTNTAAFNLYRLQIDSVANPSSANSVQLAEIELLGTPAYSYWWTFGDGTTSARQNPGHTYSGAGSFLATAGVSYGMQTGTNTISINIGAPLSVVMTATPTNTPAPGLVRFIAQASGGNLNRLPYDTTDNQYGVIDAQGGNPPNEMPAKAFDNITTTKWLDFASAHPSTRSSWIQYGYAHDARFIVSRYTVTSANDATGFPQRNPASWRLLASSDAGGSWDTLDIRSNQVFAANYQTLSFPVTNTNGYNLYRFQIDSVANAASATCMQLAELEFIGTPAVSYTWAFGDGATSSERNPQHLYRSNGLYTVTLAASDGTATAYQTLRVNVLPLALQAATGPDNSLSLAWPDWAFDYELYATTNLSLPMTAWSKVTNSVTDSGGLFRVQLPLDSDSRFFQLQLPPP